MPWGVVDSLLLWKEMAVLNNGWDSRSWDFLGGLVMPSPWAITIVNGLLTYKLGHNPRTKNQKLPNYFVK